MYILLKFIMTAVRDNIADMGITLFIFIFFTFFTLSLTDYIPSLLWLNWQTLKMVMYSNLKLSREQIKLHPAFI